MLVLVFYLGQDKYIVKYEQVREISPMVLLKKVPHSPDYLAGLFNYRGMIVPVIDLCQLIQNRPCQMRLSTRIILVNSNQADNIPEVFGFMAERVTEAVRKSEDAFVSSGINMEEASYLGNFIMEQEKMVQCIDVDKLSSKFQHWPITDHVSNDS